MKNIDLELRSEWLSVHKKTEKQVKKDEEGDEYIELTELVKVLGKKKDTFTRKLYLPNAIKNA